MIGQSLRVTGKFTAFASEGAISTSATGLRMNEQLGVYSCFNEVHISSQKTAQNIETIRHYPRMMSSYLGVTSSLQDGISHLNETALIDMNYALQERGVIENPSGKTTSNSFCVPLVCGLLNGTDPIPLSSQWGVGGLDISIHLAPDSNVFFSSGSNTTAITGAYYELSDVKLVCEVIRPAPDMLSRLMSQTENVFEYNSITSMFNTINSRNGVLNFPLGVSRCLGVFLNIVPASHINNLAFDGTATLPPTNSAGTRATISQLVFTRGGERFPLEYNVDTLQKDTPRNLTMDSQVVRNYMNAVMGSFSDVPFGLQMTSDITTDSPQGIYLFAHCKNTVVSNGQGIQIMN